MNRNYDFSILKDFPISGERVHAEFRADMLNAFNTPYFTEAASLDVTSPQFGQAVLSQDNQPRKIVFGFKLFF